MSKEIKIVFNYSSDLEIRRIIYTIKKIDWYKNNGYTVDLPKKLEELETEELKNLTKEKVREFVLKEYEEKEYLEKINKIKTKWSNISAGLLKKLKELGFKPEPSYNIILTKYGVGGSYNLPNEIIINFKNRGEKFIQTVIHEIIHLLIEPRIQKYKISHWEKERIVDLISLKINQELGYTQRLPKSVNVKRIDETFEKFFPDIKK